MTIDNLSGQTLAITLVVAIFVALITEGIKYFDKHNIMTPSVINLLTLLLGWGGGMACMVIFKGDFETYTFMGFGAGVLSPGIYEFVNNLFGGAK